MPIGTKGTATKLARKEAAELFYHCFDRASECGKVIARHYRDAASS
jgi:hypothetical protein